MRLEKIPIVLAISIALAYCASSQSKIARKNEKDPQYQYEKALIAMKYGLEDETIKILNQVLALDSNHYQSYNLLGTIFFNKRNFVEAVSAYQKCVKIQPDFSEAHNNLGFVYQEMGNLDKAEEEYKKACLIDSNFNASFNLATLYFKQNKLELALDYVQKAIQKSSRSAKAYNLQGVILNKMEKYPAAIESFQYALSTAPKDIVSNINLGIAFINNKDLDRARELFEDILPLVQDQTLIDKINEYLKIIKDNK